MSRLSSRRRFNWLKPAGRSLGGLALGGGLIGGTAQLSWAQEGGGKAEPSKPNIILIVCDDFGYGDAGVYGGGPGRGMPTPNIDRLGDEGMVFFSFYAQPSCTPGRAAMQTGRIPNRSGMTTVAFQGQGGGLPAAEWTLASVLKTAGYRTYFTGKWHLGEADYALPNAQGYDVMEHCFLYHLNAYTYGDPNWFPDMDPKLREMFDKVTKGSLSGNAGQKAHQDFKVNGEYVDTPDKGIVGIPFLDKYIESSGIEFLEDAAKHPDEPFFININFMKVHQPNLPAPSSNTSLSPRRSSRIRLSRWTRASATLWTSCASWAWTRIPTCSGPPTTGPGRMSTRTPATRRSAAPRVPIVKAATASPPLRGVRRSRPVRGTATSSAVWTSWRPSRRWPA